MDYATVIEAFFAPETAAHATPAPVTGAGPARRLRDAFGPLAMHAVWSPLVHERLAAQERPGAKDQAEAIIPVMS